MLERWHNRCCPSGTATVDLAYVLRSLCSVFTMFSPNSASGGQRASACFGLSADSARGLRTEGLPALRARGELHVEDLGRSEGRVRSDVD